MTELGKLARNVAAGARLALGLPVHRLSFRVDVAQLLLVFAFSALIDVAGDWVRYGPDVHFSWLGAGNEFFTLGLLVAVAALVAIVARRASLTIALSLIVLAGAPMIQAADVMLTLVLQSADVPQFAASWLAYVVPVWFVAMIVRATWIAFEGEGRRRIGWALLAGILLAAPTWLAPTLFQSMPWWTGESTSFDAGTGDSPVSELVQAAQQKLLDDALGALDDERPGATDLYFVGFAADAREPALHDDVVRAQRVMDERWDTRARSIVLANDPKSLLDAPFATVTHLRETLREIGATIDAESDVVMIYLAGRGSGSGVEVSHPPLDLLPLSPGTLRALLEDAGIKWSIVVVSACESSAFHEALADENTVVLTAGSADCTSDKATGELGDALFAHALAERESFSDALRAVANASGTGSGKPTLSIGSAIADVLKALDRGNTARRNGRSV